ncbi:LacI family transcriptional regulator [bacterium]|nr:MAG: LacI family transcriptional regulator [bacterium]
MYRTRVHQKNGGRPTRDDVAKQANISGATVSRVLSGRTDVQISPETRARVLEAAEKLGYRPNVAARALMTGRTGLVGFWMSLQYSRYRGHVLDRMRTILSGTELALAVTDVDVEYTSSHSFERALRVPVDGIIAFDNSASVEAFARQHDRIAPNVPFVSMGAYWSEAQSFVGVDLRSGADAAMAHFRETGRKRIAYMVPFNSDLVAAGPRFEAYRHAMDEAGGEGETILVEDERIGSVKSALTERLSKGLAPEAILCMNDDLAIACAFALPMLGLAAGRDVALIGFDGIEEGAYGPCPITTVRQPIEAMCSLAFDFLRAQIDDPEAPLHQRVLVPELIVRDSTQS